MIKNTLHDFLFLSFLSWVQDYKTSALSLLSFFLSLLLSFIFLDKVISPSYQRENRKQEPDDEAGDQFDGPVSSPPARETVVPKRRQELLTVRLSHELKKKREKERKSECLEFNRPFLEINEPHVVIEEVRNTSELNIYLLLNVPNKLVFYSET